jgi:integrase
VTVVDRAAISRLHQRLGNEVGRIQANRVLGSLSAAWVWALRTGLVGGDNPAACVPKFTEQPRERVLSPHELRLIWQCTDSDRPFDRIVRLLLLTACRRQEIGGMRWTEIEGDLLVVPAARMKRSRPHEVPLSSLALAQLPKRNGDGCVFSTTDAGFDGWSRVKKALDGRIASISSPLPPWGLHDMRRTFSTMTHERGLAEPHIIEAVLAHEGAQSGVAGVYNRAAYREQKRAALNAWAELITDIVRETLPADIQATIARGNAAFNKNMIGPACPSIKVKAPAITTIIDPDDQVRRESRLKTKTQRATGRRGQPPMVDRLRVVTIYVDHLEARGVPFATARNSRMNIEVRRRLNGLMANSKDKRKSRRKLITADTVTILLRQVAELRKPAHDHEHAHDEHDHLDHDHGDVQASETLAAVTLPDTAAVEASALAPDSAAEAHEAHAQDDHQEAYGHEDAMQADHAPRAEDGGAAPK